MNQLHVIANIARFVVAGKDASQVYHNIRDLIDLDTVGMSRSKVEKQAKDAIEAFENFTLAIEKRKFELDAEETELRADIIDALQQVDLTVASRVREIHTLTREIISSGGSPTLVEGLDMLDELKVDTSEFRARLDKLGFLELEKDDPVEPVEPVCEPTEEVKP